MSFALPCTERVPTKKEASAPKLTPNVKPDKLNVIKTKVQLFGYNDKGYVWQIKINF